MEAPSATASVANERYGGRPISDEKAKTLKKVRQLLLGSDFS